MNTLLNFVTFVMVIVLLILTLVIWSTNRDTLSAMREEIREVKDAQDFHEHSSFPAAETGEFPAVREDREPIPFDSSNPPRRMVYRGPVGKRKCTCHSGNIQPGQAVYLWPRPDREAGTMDIYCESWIHEQGAQS